MDHQCVTGTLTLSSTGYIDMENPYDSSTSAFSYFKPEVLDNFLFKEDIEDEEECIDVNDVRLTEVFLLDDPAEQELKSTIFFGRKFKNLVR